MYPLRKITKAKIESLDNPGTKFEFRFNPSNLKVERSSGLKGRTTEKLKLTSFAGLEWDGAGTDTLSFDFVRFFRKFSILLISLCPLVILACTTGIDDADSSRADSFSS